MANVGAIYIVEGVAGSGKDTYIGGLLSRLDAERRPVYSFDEAAILFSWKHYYLPDIDLLCLRVLESVVRHVGFVLDTETNAAFVFDRFHVSFLARALLRTPRLEPELVAELEAGYEHIVESLRQLPVHIVMLTLAPDELETRVAHPERADAAWRSFLEQRVAESPHSSTAELWGEQQEMMLRLLERDGLPYEVVRVRPPG